LSGNVKKVLIEVLGYPEDYACLTAYMWINEIKELLESDFNVEVETRFKDIREFKELSEAPAILVNGHVVMKGLPSEAGYYYEVIYGFLKKSLSTS